MRHFYTLNLVAIMVITSCSGNELKKQIQQNNAIADFAIYEHILKDSNNFFLYSEEDRFSDIKYVLRESKRWEKERFFIPVKNKLFEYFSGVDDELSDYNRTYLFEKHEDYVTTTEKTTLAEFSGKLQPETIQYTFKNLIPIEKSDRFKGFCVQLARPIYASNNESAFLDMYLHRNYTEAVLDTTTYYEKIGFILKKDARGNWKTIERKIRVLL